MHETDSDGRALYDVIQISAAREHAKALKQVFAFLVAPRPVLASYLFQSVCARACCRNLYDILQGAAVGVSLVDTKKLLLILLRRQLHSERVRRLLFLSCVFTLQSARNPVTVFLEGLAAKYTVSSRLSTTPVSVKT